MDKKLAFALFLVVTIFLIDLTLPLGIPDSFAYLIPVVLVTQFFDRTCAYKLAVLCTILTLTGAYFSTDLHLVPLELAIFFICFVVLSIWISTLFGLRYKEAWLSVQKASDQCKTILDSASDAIISLDLKGNITGWSAGATKMYGYSADELLGLPFDILLPEGRKHEVNEAIKKICAGQSIQIRESERKAKDGSIHHVSWTVDPIFDLRKNLSGVFSIARDISLQKQIEASLKRAKNIAEAGSKAKSGFLANMSHEIRTPLSAIIGFSELLKMDRNLEASNEWIERIYANASHLKELVDDILDLSKVESRKMEIEKVSFCLKDILLQEAGLVRSQVRSRSVKLRTHFGSLPKECISDPTKVRQVVKNLLSNAVKFTQSGFIKLTTVTENDGRIKIYVQDTGIGISHEGKQKIFEPFAQLKNKVGLASKGTGLGLAISKNLAQLLGGDLTLTSSEEGVGSQFLFEFMAHADVTTNKVNVLSVGSNLEILEAKEKPIYGKHVLVVEDDFDILTVSEAYLKRGGARVTKASNGLEALDCAKETHFDLILMDLSMPHLDGYLTISKLKEEGCEIPVVALTAYNMKEERDRAIKAGFKEFVSKPFTYEKLLKTVAQNCSGENWAAG